MELGMVSARPGLLAGSEKGHPDVGIHLCSGTTKPSSFASPLFAHAFILMIYYVGSIEPRCFGLLSSEVNATLGRFDAKGLQSVV
jgi:hypothetical protein